jgi:hypothetical protein
MLAVATKMLASAAKQTSCHSGAKGQRNSKKVQNLSNKLYKTRENAKVITNLPE